MKDVKENLLSDLDLLIGYIEPFYYCKEHSDVKNIHKEEIEFHILNSTIHKSS